MRQEAIFEGHIREQMHDSRCKQCSSIMNVLMQVLQAMIKATVCSCVGRPLQGSTREQSEVVLLL